MASCSGAVSRRLDLALYCDLPRDMVLARKGCHTRIVSISGS